MSRTNCHAYSTVLIPRAKSSFPFNARAKRLRCTWCSPSWPDGSQKKFLASNLPRDAISYCHLWTQLWPLCIFLPRDGLFVAVQRMQFGGIGADARNGPETVGCLAIARLSNKCPTNVTPKNVLQECSRRVSLSIVFAFGPVGFIKFQFHPRTGFEPPVQSFFWLWRWLHCIFHQNHSSCSTSWSQNRQFMTSDW